MFIFPIKLNYLVEVKVKKDTTNEVKKALKQTSLAVTPEAVAAFTGYCLKYDLQPTKESAITFTKEYAGTFGCDEGKKEEFCLNLLYRKGNKAFLAHALFAEKDGHEINWQKMSKEWFESRYFVVEVDGVNYAFQRKD